MHGPKLSSGRLSALFISQEIFFYENAYFLCCAQCEIQQ